MQRRLLYQVFMLSLVLLHTQAQLFLKLMDETPEIIKDPATVKKDWKKMENLLKTLVNEAIKTLMPLVMDHIQDVNISSTCIRDSIQLFAGIRKLQTWALRFIDSSSKDIDGILTGNMFSYGAYDECVDTVATNQRSGRHKGEVMFTGKYCTVRIKPSLPPRKAYYKLDEVMEELKDFDKKGTVIGKAASYAQLLYYFSLRLGLCIPSGCSVDDINQVLSKVSNFTSLYVKVNRCEVKEDPKFTPLMICVVCLYSFAGFMVLLGTVIDLYCYYTARKLTHKSFQMLLIFSLLSNFPKFIDTSTSSTILSCLNGIRFLTLAWVIVGHTYIYALNYLTSGTEYVRYMVGEFAVQVLVNATISVDTFFFLSGLLVCYVTTKHVKTEKREFSIKMYIIHRLFRVLPGYIFVILFVFIIEAMVSGPAAYNATEAFVDGCRKNLWTNLLFISNFYNADDMCMPHTWYLSMDMQFYIGALIILLPLLKCPKVGMSIAAISIIGFLLSCGILTYTRGYPPMIVISDPNLERHARYVFDFYMKPYPHGSSYIFGIMTGYLLATKPKLKIPRLLLWFGWSAAIICSTSAVYGTYKWNHGTEPTLSESILYGSLHRFAWVVGVAWMVVCCATGYGGIVNYILSLKMWIPLGRLTFMAYLVHPVVQMLYFAGVRHPIPPMHSFGVCMFFGHLIATYGVAFIGCMVIESPLIALEKILLSRGGGGGERLNKTGKNTDHTVNFREGLKTVDVVSLKSNSHVCQSKNGADNLGSVIRL